MEAKPLLKDDQDDSDDIANVRRYKDDPLFLEVRLGKYCTCARIIFITVAVFTIGFYYFWIYIKPWIDNQFIQKTSASHVT